MKMNRLGGNQVKIFLSWSGEQSRQLADAFANWLPNVLQHVEPYISSKNIGLGERALDNIKSELENSSFGIVFVTKENIKAPWINYEAGAISNSLGIKRIIPVMYDCDLIELDNSPLRQFQAAKDLEKDNVRRIIMAINSVSDEFELDHDRVEKAFDQWWEVLEDDLISIKKNNPSVGKIEKEPSQEEIVKATYQLVQSSIVNNTFNSVDRVAEEVKRNNKQISQKLGRIIAKMESQELINMDPNDTDLGKISEVMMTSMSVIGELEALRRQLNGQSPTIRIKKKKL